MLSWTKHPSATFFTAEAQGNNEVIWLSVFAACSCFVPTGDVRETSIKSAILSRKKKVFYTGITATYPYLNISYFGINLNGNLTLKHHLQVERDRKAVYVPFNCFFYFPLFYFLHQSSFLQATIMVYQAVAEYWASPKGPEFDLNVDILLPGRSKPEKFNFNVENRYKTRTSKVRIHTHTCQYPYSCCCPCAYHCLSLYVCVHVCVCVHV